MTPLQWTLLCGIFTIYLLIGGSIFMTLEEHAEIIREEEVSILRQDVQEILLRLDRNYYRSNTSKEVLSAIRAAKEGVLNRISDVCGGSINFLERPDGSQLKWNYYNSVFFAFTIVTTIGYGHIVPSTDWSRVFVIFYALVGIPLNGILLQGLADYFSSKFVKAHEKSKSRRYENKATLIFDIIFYLTPGIVVFIILPAAIFTFIEDWTYLESVYYSFVTLATIGFGDYVAGAGDGHTVWMWLYKAAIMIWILFGLGYLLMILGYIAKGLTHKKVRIVIENRLNNIKNTKDKLSNDVAYMRRVINELYMMKIKPVLTEEATAENDQYYMKSVEIIERTQSHPCLRQLERERNSLQSVPSSDATKRPTALGRTLSETDLGLIDKQKTFEEAISQCVLPDELLAAVLNVLNENVVHDVLEAVDELNEFEDQYKVETNLRKKQANELAANLTPWVLGMVHESDEEILITDADADAERRSLTETLEEVIIHTSDDPSKPPSQNLLDKVNAAIRKISTGNRTPSEGPSRKVSRNEERKSKKSEEAAAGRKISQPPSFSCISYSNPASRKVSQNDPPDRRYLSSCDHDGYYNGGGPSHQQGRVSVPGSPRLMRSSSLRRSIDRSSDLRRSGHHKPNRKISAESDKGAAPLTIETTSLADFLRALDTVHHKLKTAEPPDRGESADRRPAQSGPRRRKIGVFNPGFSFVNQAYNPDEDELPSTSRSEGSASNPKNNEC